MIRKEVLALAILTALSAFAAPPPRAVPIDEEPMHHRKFENEYVRVFDVVVPTAGQTLFHVHSHDYIFVALGDAHVRSEPLDGKPIELTFKNGEARFTAGPVTHRAVNLDATPFHNLTVEILKPAGSPPEAPLPAMPGHSLVFENDRVRIDRQILEPGESTGLHTHTLSSLGICVSPARVEYSEPGEKPVVADLEAGPTPSRTWAHRDSRRSRSNGSEAAFRVRLLHVPDRPGVRSTSRRRRTPS